MNADTQNPDAQNLNTQNVSTQNIISQPTYTKDDQIENAKLYLEVVKGELDYETQRKSSIENRVGFFLALTGALSAFLFTIVKIPLINLNNLKQIDILILVLNVLFMAFIYYYLIRSMFYFFKVLDTTGYDRIDLSTISERNLNEDKLLATFRIVQTYKDVAMRYRNKNQDKADKYSKAIKDLSIGLFLIVIYYVLNNLLLIGGLTK